MLSPTSPKSLITERTSRKTLFYLISTLNNVYPDYDFQDLKPEDFQKVLSQMCLCFSSNETAGTFSWNILIVQVPLFEFVLNRVNNQFLVHFGNLQKQLGSLIWETIDEIITTKDCSIYVYTPELGGLDDDEGNFYIASVHYSQASFIRKIVILTIKEIYGHFITSFTTKRRSESCFFLLEL